MTFTARIVSKSSKAFRHSASGSVWAISFRAGSAPRDQPIARSQAFQPLEKQKS
jgi:hypothetical protein